MNRQQSLTRQPGERPAVWKPRHESELQQAIEDGNTKSFRTYKGKTYGVIA